MSNDAEMLIRKIQGEYSSYFIDGDPSNGLTRAGMGAINPTKALLDNFSEFNRFIEEMIQNAEDSRSSEIIFNVHEDKIIIENNGKQFDEQDVEAITIVGNSTKQSSDSIGMFGLGFKSVFLLSDAPRIISGKFNFSFNTNTYIYPYLETQKPEGIDSKKTYVVLPLKKNLISIILKSIRGHYNKTGELILFLKNLRKIQIIDYELGELTFEKKKNDEILSIYRTQDNQKQLTSKWLIKSNNFKINKSSYTTSLNEGDRRIKANSICVDLAFEIDRDNSLVEKKDKALYSFLSTKYLTNLPFIINSDFQLTGDRERIKEDSSWNNFIFSCAFDLFKESIDFFKNHKDYKKTFYGIIPEWSVRPHGKEILIKFYNNVLEYCKSSEIVLTHSQVFKKGEKCYFDDKGIIDVIPNETVLKYEGKEFVSNEIPTRFRQLISTFSVKYFNETKILSFLKEQKNYIKGLSDEKLLKLYSKLHSIFPTKLIDSIKELDIFKTQDSGFTNLGEMQSNPLFLADDSDNSFAKDKNIEIKYLDKNLSNKIKSSSDINLKAFFDTLDRAGYVKTFDINSYVANYLILLFRDQKNSERFFEVTSFIMNNLTNLEDSAKRSIREGILVKTSCGKWIKPSKVYFSKAYGGDDVFELISEHFEIDILSKEYLKKKDVVKDWVQFFKEIGVNYYFQTEEIDRYHNGIDHGSNSVDCSILRKIFKKLRYIDETDRYKIAIRIFASIDSNWEHYRNKLITHEYKPKIEMGQEVGCDSIENPTQFLSMLRTSDWIPNSSKTLLRPDEVYLDKEAIRDYDKNLPRLQTGYSFKNKEMIEALGIRERLDSNVYIKHLIRLKDSKQDFDLLTLEKIYSEIASSISSTQTNTKIEEIKSVFNENCLIFVPNKLGASWKSPEECFLYKDDIVKGYLQGICNLYQNKGTLRLFEDYLHVKERPSTEDYLLMLKEFSQTEPTKALMTTTLKIYKQLSRELEECEDNKESPHWLKGFLEGSYIISSKGTFENRKDIFENDNQELAEIFQDHLSFLFIPTLSIKPRIQALLDKLELQTISSSVKQVLIKPSIKHSISIEKYIPIISIVERGLGEYILKHYNGSNAKANLTKLSVKFVDKINLKLSIKNLEKTIETDQYYSLDDQSIYLKFQTNQEIKKYKQQISRAISQVYGISSLFGHVFNIIQICILDGDDIFEFYKKEGINLPKDEFDISFLDKEEEIIHEKVDDKDIELPKAEPKKNRAKVKEPETSAEAESIEDIFGSEFEKSEKEDSFGEPVEEANVEAQKREVKEVYVEREEVETAKKKIIKEMDELSKKKNEFVKEKDQFEKEKSKHEENIRRQREEIKRGRTISPSKEDNFLDKLKNVFGKKSSAPENPQTYYENDEPMSLEEKEEFEQRIKQELEEEIVKVRSENKKRGYKVVLQSIGKNEDVIQEVKNFYNGKCQICGWSFKDLSGRSYCEIVDILPKRYGGVRFPGNKLCLCPNHAAMKKHSFSDYDNIKIQGNNLYLKLGRTEHKLRFKPTHMAMLKVLFKLDDVNE
jgi:hypothetical protein